MQTYSKPQGAAAGRAAQTSCRNAKPGRPIVYIGEFGAQEALDEADGRRMKRCDTVHE